MNKRVHGFGGLLGHFAVAFLLVAVVPTMAQAYGTAREAFEAGRLAKDSKVRRAAFSEGMVLAQARLDKNANDAEGLFWKAVNMGAEALERGKMSALPVVPKMEALLLTLDKVDPAYEQAGAARVLGRLYHQAPAVISVGSNKEARKFLAKAVGLAPGHPGNLAFAADFLYVHGDRSVARDYAVKSLRLLLERNWGSEGEEWRELAVTVVEKTQ